jgi:hypothetical protein
MPRRARGRAADSDSDSDFDPEVVTSESDEVIELDDLGEPSSARKRSKRKVRIESPTRTRTSPKHHDEIRRARRAGLHLVRGRFARRARGEERANRST